MTEPHQLDYRIRQLEEQVAKLDQRVKILEDDKRKTEFAMIGWR